MLILVGSNVFVGPIPLIEPLMNAVGGSDKTKGIHIAVLVASFFGVNSFVCASVFNACVLDLLGLGLGTALAFVPTLPVMLHSVGHLGPEITGLSCVHLVFVFVCVEMTSLLFSCLCLCRRGFRLVLRFVFHRPNAGSLRWHWPLRFPWLSMVCLWLCVVCCVCWRFLFIHLLLWFAQDRCGVRFRARCLRAVHIPGHRPAHAHDRAAY